MTRTAIAAAMLAASVSLALAATDEDLRTQIIGKWGADAACTTATVTFAADGSYAAWQANGKETGGAWSLVDGILRLTKNGDPQPDATVVIAGDVLSLSGTHRGQAFTQDLHRCPA